MAPVRHVLIVGAGLAGVATVVHLARHDGRDSIGSITVVDPNRPGHGLASAVEMPSWCATPRLILGH